MALGNFSDFGAGYKTEKLHTFFAIVLYSTNIRVKVKLFIWDSLVEWYRHIDSCLTREAFFEGF